jgi:prolyl oligopeptidase
MSKKHKYPATNLYGYGGFAINMTPMFQAHRLAWIEQGGIYAQAVLRGGMEYGEEWYAGGSQYPARQ